MADSRRIIGWAIAAAALVLCGLLAMLAIDRVMRGSAIETTHGNAVGDARILAAGLESELEKFRLVPPVLAEDPDVIALMRGDAAKAGALNRRLDSLSRQTDAAVIYLMNAQGQTLSSSNYARPDNFVGFNYRFRSYFRESMEDGGATQFALGTVSRRPGLYIARRIGSLQTPLGVVALKVKFDRSEARWRESGKAIFVTDGDGIVLLASNPAWRFRSTKALSAQTRNREEDRRRFGVTSLRPLDLGSKSQHMVTIALDQGGDPEAPAGWTLHLLNDPAGDVAAAVARGRLAVGLIMAVLAMLGGIALFIQRRRVATRELELARRTGLLREQLSQANRLAMLGQIGAGISHEIRQPVAAIRMFAENGTKLIHAGDFDRATANFGQISQLADRIGTITGELLRFSRRGTRAQRPMPIGQVIDGALLLLTERIAGLGVEIDRPAPADGAIDVMGEHVRLEQVLVNLLKNALDAVGTYGNISIEITPTPGNCQLAVCDDGPGLTDDAMDRLFQPFATTKDDGLGLGLVISKEIMRELGGDLRADPRERGACFVMEVPRA